jgi:hypothetical protein
MMLLLLLLPVALAIAPLPPEARQAEQNKGSAAPAAPKEQLVVVFAKGVAQAKAEAVLRQQPYPWRQGSDSSRGKVYFYRTGPKYLLDVPAAEQAAVMERLRKAAGVYEVYQADWQIQKD